MSRGRCTEDSVFSEDSAFYCTEDSVFSEDSASLCLGKPRTS